jgi:hypothetical protein
VLPIIWSRCVTHQPEAETAPDRFGHAFLNELKVVFHRSALGPATHAKCVIQSFCPAISARLG